MNAAVISKTGSKSSDKISLNKDIFEVEVKSTELLKTAYLSYLAAGRTNNAITLQRGDVRGGGKKPWKQKGTGRARHGSIRSPIWRGGGITFGPQGNENYKKNLSKKAKLTALKQALSLAVKDGNLTIIEALDASDGKTKSIASVISNAELKGSITLIVDKIDLATKRAASNIPNLSLVSSSNVQPYHVMSVKNVLVAKDALSSLEDRINAKPGEKSIAKAKPERKLDMRAKANRVPRVHSAKKTANDVKESDAN